MSNLDLPAANGHDSHMKTLWSSEVAIIGFFAILIAVPSLLIGAALPVLQVAVTSALFCGLILVSAFARRERLTISPVTWLLISAMFFTLLQSLPLGETLSSLLGGASRTRAKEVSLGSVLSSISVEPLGSLLEAFKLAGYAAFFLGIENLSHKKGPTPFIYAVGLAGILQVATGVINLVIGPSHLFGLYASPLTEREGFHCTLLNDNHASALMNLGAFSWLALAMDRARVYFRPYYLLAMVVCCLGSLATLSRGGGATLLMGIFGFFMWYRLHEQGLWSAKLRSIGFVALITLFILVLAVFEEGINQIAGTTLFPPGWGAKVATWQPALQLIMDHPIAGVGRGGVVTAITAYNDTMPDNSIPFIENIVLQAMSDWGAFFGAIWLLAWAFLIGRTVLAWFESPSMVAAGFGLVVVALHNLFDFSLEMPGIALPYLAIFGAMSGALRLRGQRVSSLPMLALSLFMLTILATTSPWLIGHSREADAQILVQRHDCDNGDDKNLQEALSRHPHDAYLLVIGSRLATKCGALDKALDLANRALVLAPSSWDAGMTAAEAAIRKGVGAAPYLARLAREHPYRQRELFEFLDRLPAGDAFDVFTEDPEGRLAYLAHIKGQWAREEAFLRAGIRKQPDDYDLLLRLAVLYLDAGKLDAASNYAAKLMALFPEKDGGWYVLSRVYRLRMSFLEALALCYEAAWRNPSSKPLWHEILILLVELKRWDEFDRVVQEVYGLFSQDRYYSSRLHLLLGDRALYKGDVPGALRELDRAAIKWPTDPGIFLKKARILRDHGRFQEARLAYEAALRLQPDDEALKKEYDAIKNSARSVDTIP